MSPENVPMTVAEVVAIRDREIRWLRGNDMLIHGGLPLSKKEWEHMHRQYGGCRDLHIELFRMSEKVVRMSWE